MPESPELALSRDYLKKVILGKKIINCYCSQSGRYRERSPEGFEKLCLYLKQEPLEIVSINTHGKFMWWSFQSLSKQTLAYLFCTYGMSGQWLVEESNHTAFTFDFSDGSSVHFNDPRHFGTLKFDFGLNGLGQLSNKLKSLGPDMLGDPPNFYGFKTRLLQYKNKTLPEVLMNQKAIAGVGNYIKAEALYRAKLSPHRVISSLSDADFDRLRQVIIDVMAEAYKLGGASISTYINPGGTKGKATDFFAVYKKKTDPVGRQVIKESTKDKRTTWWCPEVQV